MEGETGTTLFAPFSRGWDRKACILPQGSTDSSRLAVLPVANGEFGQSWIGLGKDRGTHTPALELNVAGEHVKERLREKRALRRMLTADLSD